MNLPTLRPSRSNPLRVTLHWTGGLYRPSDSDLAHYHFLIDGSGETIRGVPLERNCPIRRPGYAAHTSMANSNNIGIAICGMLGAKVGDYGKYPIKAMQVDEAIDLIADICKAYDIKPTPAHVLGHSEWQSVLGVRQRGKWDVTVLPYLKVGPGNNPDGTSVAMNHIRRMVSRLV